MRERVIFVEGAPRSGTTLLVSLLAAHPEIAATASESHLFDLGVGSLFDNLERPERGEDAYLSGYLARPALVDLVRDLCDGVFAEMRSRTKPGASRVAEKTPAPREGAVRLVERKLEVYPDATYVHVRRQRDAMVESLLRMPWARCSRAEAEEWWAQAVTAYGGIEGRAEYVELAYEELADDPVSAAGDLFRRLGLDTGPELEAALEAAAGDRISGGPPPEPAVPAAGGPGGGRRLARRLRSVVSLRAPGEHRPPDTDVAQELIVAARSGEPEAIAELTAEDFELTVRTGIGDGSAKGERARAALLALAGELFGTELTSEVWTGPVSGGVTSFVLATVRADGRRADVSFTALVGGDRVERLGVISAGPVSGRSPAPLRGLFPDHPGP